MGVLPHAEPGDGAPLGAGSTACNARKHYENGGRDHARRGKCYERGREARAARQGRAARRRVGMQRACEMRAAPAHPAGAPRIKGEAHQGRT